MMPLHSMELSICPPERVSDIMGPRSSQYGTGRSIERLRDNYGWRQFDHIIGLIWSRRENHVHGHWRKRHARLEPQISNSWIGRIHVAADLKKRNICALVVRERRVSSSLNFEDSDWRPRQMDHDIWITDDGRIGAYDSNSGAVYRWNTRFFQHGHPCVDHSTMKSAAVSISARISCRRICRCVIACGCEPSRI